VDCRQIIELLPWFLNGSLSPDEDRQLRGHLKDCDRCRAELGEVLFAAKMFSTHPETAALVELVFDPPSADRQALEQHLLLCPDCAEQVALLRRSAFLLGERVKLPDPVPYAVRRVSRLWRPAAVAASLLSVLSLGGWYYAGQRSVAADQELADQSRAAEARDAYAREEISQLKAELNRRETESAAQTAEYLERLAKLTMPRLNVPVIELWPSSFRVRSGAPNDEVTEVPADAGLVMLILPVLDDTPFAEYELELVGADREVIWNGSGLTLQPEGDLTVFFPSSLLKKGEMIRIYGRDGSEREQVESYSFRVVSRPAKRE